MFDVGLYRFTDRRDKTLDVLMSDRMMKATKNYRNTPVRQTALHRLEKVTSPDDGYRFPPGAYAWNHQGLGFKAIVRLRSSTFREAIKYHIGI